MVSFLCGTSKFAPNLLWLLLEDEQDDVDDEGGEDVEEKAEDFEPERGFDLGECQIPDGLHRRHFVADFVDGFVEPPVRQRVFFSGGEVEDGNLVVGILRWPANKDILRS